VEDRISKSRFKARALELFREIERTGRALVITDHARPVLRIGPYTPPDPAEALRSLRGSVLRYDDPLEPVGLEDWEALH
jgi:antitoxin (DNA-binding transcriptional repressor) of toxin-antitoxin stability system